MFSFLIYISTPFLNNFYAVRDNAFWNHEVKSHNQLEEMGNFFLAPSRYLFGGKTVLLSDKRNEIVLTQSFEYQTLPMLKTLLSTQTLAFSWIVGGGLKAISYLSPETQANHLSLRSYLDDLYIASNESIYKEAALPALFSNQIGSCEGREKVHEMNQRQKVEFEALKKIAALLDTHHIAWWVDRGTALGAYRHAGMIPWDHDIDISILQKDHDNVMRILKQLDTEKYKIQDWSSYNKPKSYMRLYIVETKSYIDIYNYAIDESRHELSYIFSLSDSKIMPQKWKKREFAVTSPLKYETIFPLKQLSFDGLTVKVPSDLKTFLQSKYGENLEPSRVWNPRTKKYERIKVHPYWKQSHI